jgi:signal transduction histidine kinase
MLQTGAFDYRTVLDAVPDHAAILDETGRVVFVNEPWIDFAAANGCRMPKAGVGASYLDVCEATSGEERPVALNVCQGLRDVISGIRRDFRLEYEFKDHNLRQWYALRANRIAIPGGPPFPVLVLHDNLTEHKTARQKLAWANAEIRQFMYFAGHELDEPLRWITGFAKLLVSRYRDAVDQDGRDFMEYILTSATRLNAMTREVLMYSRLLDRTEFEFEPVDLNQLADMVANYFEPEREERGFEFTRDHLPVILGVEGLLEQVFRHLASNALKYGGTPPHFHLGAERRGMEWVISARDNGKGIPEASRSKIFLPFHTLRQSGTTGTGLGLALVRRIIELHGGKITVESKVGEGSTFFISLPDVPPEPQPLPPG